MASTRVQRICLNKTLKYLIRLLLCDIWIAEHFRLRYSQQRIKQRDGQFGVHHTRARELISHLTQGLLHRLQL